MSNKNVFLRMYRDVMMGNIVAPRGIKVREQEDYMMSLDMSDSPLTSFKARKLNLKYAKAEVLWYLRGNRYDTFIEQYATMWQKIRQPEGFYYSNYGHYLFEEGQIYWVIDELMRDKDSRRASCVLLQRGHMFPTNKDMVCTYGIGFRIRDGRLNMSVNMRSNDAVFGTTNDVFAFSMIYRLVLAVLQQKYELRPGVYTHKADSLHIYEHHWAMVEQIMVDSYTGYYDVPIPPCTTEEAYWLLSLKDYPDDLPQDGHEFAKWLYDIKADGS